MRVIFEKISLIEIIKETEDLLNSGIDFILKTCKKGWEELQTATDKLLEMMSFDENN